MPSDSCPATYSIFFFFNDTATTEIYTLSLHDALPISIRRRQVVVHDVAQAPDSARPGVREIDLRAVLGQATRGPLELRDRKSTRLNSSHDQISYAVFCLKKKNTTDSRARQTHGGAFAL